MGANDKESPGRTPVVDYGHPTRWVSGRRGRRTVAAVVILSVAVAAYRPARPIVARVAENWKWSRAQRVLMRFEIPEGELVLQETGSPVSAAAYIGSPNLGVVFAERNQDTTWRNVVWGASRPTHLWDSFRDSDWVDTANGTTSKWPPITGPFTPPVRQMQLGWDGGIAYLHARTSPRGNTRLVCVSVNSEGPGFFTHVFVPGSIFTQARSAGTNSEMYIHRPETGGRVEVLAGASDPQDGSHFWFTARLNGRAFVMDGYLGDDDFVRYKARAGQMYSLGYWMMWYLGDDSWNPTQWLTPELDPSTMPSENTSH